MGTQLLPPQKTGQSPPQFSAHFYCGQTAACIKMPLGMEVGLSPGDILLDGEFSVHVYYDQTAEWIRRHLVRK